MVATEEITVEHWLTTTEVARMYRRHRDTVYDWIKDGIEKPFGRVRLKARRVGGNWLTTRQWVEDFLAACEGRDTPAVAEPPSVPARKAKAEQELARKVLGSGRKKQATRNTASASEARGER